MDNNKEIRVEALPPIKPGKGAKSHKRPFLKKNTDKLLPPIQQEPTKPTPKDIVKKGHKVTVVLLTWQRLSHLQKMLFTLQSQTFQEFDIRISNGNLIKSRYIENVAKKFDGALNIEVSHEGNEEFAFRRFAVGKQVAEAGTDIVLFIDDDVEIPNNYLEQCLRYYEKKSYKSGFAWKIDRGGSDYYRYRTRMYNPTDRVHYCGTGMSMIDASIFLDPRLIRDAPKEAVKIEDLWLSYFAQRVLKWKLSPIPLQHVQLGGADSVALYKQILKEKQTEKLPDKADFLKLLVKKYKWKL